MALVAVYGTLKRGYSNYDRLLAGREPLFRGFVVIPYRLYASPEYPMLVPAPGEEHAVLVEVFEVDEPKLEELDALEAPYHYRRETIHPRELGRSAAIYVHDAPPPAGFERVSSGDWTG